MKSESLSKPYGINLTWEELLTLAVCLALDLIEYGVPILQAPFIGDIVDLMGIIYAFLHFGVMAALTLIELIPGLDLIPVFSITWFAWYIYRKRIVRVVGNKELEKWR
jgi:hypothetical protein